MEGYDDRHHWLPARPLLTTESLMFGFDLTSLAGWQGQVHAIRLQFEGLPLGTCLHFGGLAVSNTPQAQLSSPEADSAAPVTFVEVRPPYLSERFVACGRTILAMDEAAPHLGLLTYYDQPLSPTTPVELQHQWALCKVVPRVPMPEGAPCNAVPESLDVRPQPGCLQADFSLNGSAIHLEALALRAYSESPTPQGCALLKITSNPATPLQLECGGLAEISVWDRSAWLRDPQVCYKQTTASLHDGIALLANPLVKRAVAIKSSGTPAYDAASGLRFDFATGTGWLLVAFAPETSAAQQLITAASPGEETSSRAFYANLLATNHIETPESVLDDAFQAALLTMDYNWIPPYGTNECLHHWLALWQVYPTAVFDWIGLSDRSRQTIASHVELQFESGNIASLMQDGERRFDFGGNNPTFIWQVKHYLLSTGDRAFAQQIVGAVRRVIQAYYAYEDDNDNQVPGFGIQILTQEDYIATPHSGTSPAVTGMEMWRTLALLDELIGEPGQAEISTARAAATAAAAMKLLWQPQLGRCAYCCDHLGNLRPDGQYHTLILPVVFGLLDQFQSWTSLRHLRDRLTGSQGEIYVSNNFPNHVGGVRSSLFGATWGPQAAGYMQPWAALGLNRVGLHDEAVRPLCVDAGWAMMFPHRGAWMETATELTPAYFANTAAHYAQGIIETLFGLELDLAHGCLQIQPAFPTPWPTAKLQLAPITATYQRDGHQLTYDLTTRLPLRRRLRWALPVASVPSVNVNGTAHPFVIEPGINGIWLTLETAPLTASRIVITYEPVEWSLHYTPSIAEGDPLQVTATGCVIEGLHDPCAVTAGFTANAPQTAILTIRTGQLAPWLKFGRLGQLNFSRRSVFLQCRAGSQSFWASVDLTLLPPVEAAADPDLHVAAGQYSLALALRNNGARVLAGQALLHLGDATLACTLDLAPRSELVLEFVIPLPVLRQLAPGDNPATLQLPNGYKLEIQIPVVRPFRELAPLQSGIAGQCIPLSLPEDQLISDAGWREFAAFPAGWQSPYTELPPPLESVRDQASLTCPGLPGIQFPLTPGGRLLLASHRLGRPSIRFELNRTLRKLYLLVLPFVENHDLFTRCALLKIGCEVNPCRAPFNPAEEPLHLTGIRYREAVFTAALHTPGQLDSFLPEYYVGPFATARAARTQRHGLLPLLQPHQADWPQGLPLASPYGMFPMIASVPRDTLTEGEFSSFPQPDFWASTQVIKTPSATLNVIEFDLRKNQHVRWIELESTLQDAALGLVSAVALSHGTA
jgi:hypothetical protein